jgi:hypothetical protein
MRTDGLVEAAWRLLHAYSGKPEKVEWRIDRWRQSISQGVQRKKEIEKGPILNI